MLRRILTLLCAIPLIAHCEQSLNSAITEQYSQWIMSYYTMEGQPDRTIYHWTLNRSGVQIGCQTALLIPQEIRKCIHFNALGGAKILPRNMFGNVTVVDGTRDWCPVLADSPAQNWTKMGRDSKLIQKIGLFDYSLSLGADKDYVINDGYNFQKRYSKND